MCLTRSKSFNRSSSGNGGVHRFLDAFLPICLILFGSTVYIVVILLCHTL